jgi:hypothetical protein
MFVLHLVLWLVQCSIECSLSNQLHSTLATVHSLLHQRCHSVIRLIILNYLIYWPLHLSFIPLIASLLPPTILVLNTITTPLPLFLSITLLLSVFFNIFLFPFACLLPTCPSVTSNFLLPCTSRLVSYNTHSETHLSLSSTLVLINSGSIDHPNELQ